MNSLPQLRLLHTSDWHIGRTLYGRKRYAEFDSFLSWLAGTIREKAIDVLLVAGDVFDTSAPSHRAQELYYRFLCQVAASTCRHVVVIAGNHDSPSFLNAPRDLLRTLNIYVVGSVTDSLEDEVLTLRNKEGTPELIVCAVPYLRDRDIRTAEAGESLEDKELKLIDGIRAHYTAVAALAEKRRDELERPVPIVGMGHLFTAGGQTIDGDGVRELYVGSLAHVSAGMFPACFDYLALGHLHVPQAVSGAKTMRYSGSPLPIGFGEATQSKSVCQIDFSGTTSSIKLLDVPVFQNLERIQGTLDDILDRIHALASTGAQSWLEIVYDGAEVVGDLRERLETAVTGTGLEILRIRNNRIIDRVLGQLHEEETLDDLDVNDVFARCLAIHDVSEAQRPELMRTYEEAVASLRDDDARAE